MAPPRALGAPRKAFPLPPGQSSPGKAKRVLTPQERLERRGHREFLELALDQGWPEERLVELAEHQLRLRPKAARRLCAEVTGDAAASSKASAARRSMLDVERITATLGKFFRYPPGTERGGRQVGGEEIQDPKDLDVAAIARLIDLRGKILARQRGAGKARAFAGKRPALLPSFDLPPGATAPELLGDDEPEDEEDEDGDE